MQWTHLRKVMDMNKIKKLRKENNKLDDLLYRENNELLMDMIVYLRGSDLYDIQIEEIRQDLLYMFLDAQDHNILVQERIGVNYKLFCDDIIENAPKKTTIEKFLEFFEITLLEILLLVIISFVVTFDFTRFFQTQYISPHVTLTTFSIFYLLICTFLPQYLFYHITKKSLNNRSFLRSNKKGKTSLLCGFVVAILVLFINLLPKWDMNISTISVIITFLFCLVLFLVLHFIKEYLYQKHIQMTKTLS